MIKITCTSAPILAACLNRNFFNIYRISKLIYQKDEKVNPDFLRMSVVFLHSTIEDIIRNLIYFKICKCNDKDIINRVPFLGLNDHGQAKKIFLGDLIPYENSTVKDIIKLSIEEYLNSVSFNNVKEIIKWFTILKIDYKKNKVDEDLSEIDELIKRRHKIVHYSDFINKMSSLNEKSEIFSYDESCDLEEINIEMLDKWLKIVNKISMRMIISFLGEDENINIQNVQVE